MPLTTEKPAATYSSLFPEQLADRCSPDALESNSGPVAYLHALYQQALDLEAASTSEERFTLAQRRPDIGEMVLSAEGLQKEISPLTLAINSLTRQATGHAGTETPLTKKISQTQRRAALPFHYPLAQIQAVLRHKKLPLFDLLQRAEYSFPNFCNGNLRTNELRQAMLKSTGFSPALQELLLAPDTLTDDFLSVRYGVSGTNAEVAGRLLNVEFFCSKTGLKPEQVQDLLATSGVDDNAKKGHTSVVRSTAYKPKDLSEADGRLFGAAFINSGKAMALDLEDKLKDAGIKLAIQRGWADDFARIHKIIHLKHALKLPFADVDHLLMSAMRAEGQTNDFQITRNTLRALGVFMYLKDVYDVSVEQFAALIYEVSPYAVGKQTPFLDRVLDGPAAGQLADIDDRLTLDDSEFNPDDDDADDKDKNSAATTIGRLCRAMGAEKLLIKKQLKDLKKALGLEKLTLSISLLSSLFRLNFLPRMLGRSPMEGASLLALLAIENAQVQAVLTGKGGISDAPDQPDILDALVAVANIDRWLRENQLSPTQVLALLTMPELTPEIVTVIESAREIILRDSSSDIAAACLSEAQLRGVLKGDEKLAIKNKTNTESGRHTFLELLEGYIDANGLIKADLPAEPVLRTELKTKIAGKIEGAAPITETITEQLATLLINARIKQEDMAKNVITRGFDNTAGRQNSLSNHALTLLKWIKKSPLNLLADLLNPTPSTETRAGTLKLWQDLARHSLAIRMTGLSPAGLEALVEHPQWFNYDVEYTLEPIENDDVASSEPKNLKLGLLYQLTRYRDWISVCGDNGFKEKDALNYLSGLRASVEPAAVQAAARQLGNLIGWEADETLSALPHLHRLQTDIEPGTLDSFIATLTIEELQCFKGKPNDNFDVASLLFNLHIIPIDRIHNIAAVESTRVKLIKFLNDNQIDELPVTKKQFDMGNQPERWEKCFAQVKSWGFTPFRAAPLKLKVYQTDYGDDGRGAPTTPSNLNDIDLTLRLQALSTSISISCESLLDFAWLDEESSYEEFHETGLQLLSGCSDEARQTIEPLLQEQWRHALLDYLLGYWAPANPKLKPHLSEADDLSSYFLTDVSVTSHARKTNAVTQAISSLQHYLHRIFSHLEPGYESTTLPQGSVRAWQEYLSQYGSWKQRQQQINHPENLIYYADRPKKTKAFQELEVDVNQGKLDPELLHTAVCNYLTKFERLSNLQVVSGYLDGRNPSMDTYHLIGKTNTTPIEYYWRSVDMSLRDDQARLNPLAWSEWEKIGISPSGQIPQSSFTDESTPTETYFADAIRPLIIAGRRYVFWVERDTTGLPDAKNQKATTNKKISVQYACQQSDGLWSTANELMSLDGKNNNIQDNQRLKDENYIPGLIVFVNVGGERASDPWLTVILYDCARKALGTKDKKLGTETDELGTEGTDYFVEQRDLLLIEARENKNPTMIKTGHESFKNINAIQHPYDGPDMILTPSRLNNVPVEEVSRSGLDINVSIEKSGRKLIISAINELFVEPVDCDITIEPPSSEPKYTFILPSRPISDNEFRAEHVYIPKAVGKYSLSVEVNYLQYHFIGRPINFEVSDAETDETWTTSIKKNTHQAQYLVLGTSSAKPDEPSSHAIRLNTLFGKNLVALASQNIESALGWKAQQISEPPIEGLKTKTSVDFHGANGLYFRELFLHLPALIAMRLTEQQQFEDAEQWYLHYLFDPYRADPQPDGRPAYWNTRPLAEVGTLQSKLNKQVNPTERAFVLSRYYRQAIVLSLVENWQRQGDHYYRQLTLSTLNHAWLCYQQALKLIGPLPERATVSRWKPMALSAVTDKSFRTPINTRVTEARATLESRLYNLRHGLTIDGKALPNMGWSDEAGAPFASATGALSIIKDTYNSNRAPIPAYRFRQLVAASRAAAQQLLDFGRHYMKLMEDDFNTTLSVLLKSQEIKISDFTLRLQNEAISSVKAKRRTLEISRKAAEYRNEFYAELLQEGRNTREEAATALIWTASTLKAFASPIAIVEGGLKTVPTIFGMAMGGSDMSGPAAAGKYVAESTAGLMKLTSEQLLLESGYERRAHQWEFDKQQAEWDLKLIDHELRELDIELNAATISLESTRQERANLEEAYVAMTTGFTIIPIYNWLVARQELLYAKAYDAVLSICLSQEAAWRYEMGDYKRHAFIKTSAWSDSYKGMLAGESLLVDLQEMENAYLLENERRLTIKKSFSLKQRLGDLWDTGVKDLSNGKPLLFDFKASDFDKNYPGHYLRQIRHVSVSFVLVSGDHLEDMSAILTQTGNSLLVETDEQGARYLYSGGGEIPGSIRKDQRAMQQIALSSSTLDDGLGFAPGEWVYEMMFHDGRYLPFEGTGAISQWQLEIPDVGFAKSLIVDEKSIIKDIQINLVYTAKGGDSDFTGKVKNLRASKQESQPTKK
nr:Tc toxin subunit A [uncultured Pseudomonas sp.]